MDNSVIKRSALVDDAYDDWSVVDTVTGGTQSMREAGETFLPKHPKESQANYTRRKNASFFVNFYNRTIKQAAGKVFSKDIVVNNAPPQIEEFSDNVDRMGQDITQFGRSWFEDGINFGSSYIVVDFPKLSPEATLADIAAQNARPYFVQIPTTDVLDIHYEIVNNVSVMTMFRFKQRYIESDPDTFTETIGIQVKVFRFDPEIGIVGFQVFRETQEKGDWYVYDVGTISTSRIPVVPFVANFKYPGIGSPTLFDLAMINIQHWQSSSDQRNILTIARVPMLFTKKLVSYDANGARKEIEISPNTVIESDDENGDAKWIEHKGEAIAAGRNDLKDLEQYMSVLGLELYVDRSGSMTATEKAINSAESNSILRSIAVTFRDAVESAYELVCEFYDIEMSFDVVINTEFSIPFKDFQDFSQLFEMYKVGLLTGTELLIEAKRRNLLQYTFDENRIIQQPIGDTNADQV